MTLLGGQATFSQPHFRHFQSVAHLLRLNHQLGCPRSRLSGARSRRFK
jgi:hypothetical protein